MRLYISGALLGARDLAAARKKYEEVAALLKHKGLSAYLPHQQTDPAWAQDIDPVDVFAQDLQALSGCDLILAFLDEPSLGVGAEIVLAVQQRKPVIGAYKRGASVSRFIEGLLASSKDCALLKYERLEDLVSEILSRSGESLERDHSRPLG